MRGIKAITVTVMCLICQLSFAAIYEWYDSHGNVYFSDTPHKGAKVIDLPTAQTYDPNKPLQEQKKKPEKIEAANASYESITITQPENDSTIPNMEGNVNIAIEVLPKLLDGDNIQLMLDGKAIGKPQSGGSFSLTNVNRGTHTLSAQIINKDNEEVLASQAVTFHVRRPIIQQNLPVNKSN